MHRLHNTFRRDRHPDHDTPAEPGWPERPQHLGVIGVREWKRLGTLLHLEHRLTTSDGPALAIAAGAYELALQIRGRRMRATKGEWFLRFTAAERNAFEHYRKALANLCLTPDSRARAPHLRGADRETTKLDAFIRRGKYRA